MNQRRVGQWDTAGSITNNTAAVASYEVVVGFYDDDVRLSQRSRWIRDLKPGEKARVDEGFWVGPKADEVTNCKVILINRFD